MWAEIFNHPQIQEHSSLRKLMVENFDYESIYHNVLNGQYNGGEKDAITNAVKEAYLRLDDIVRKHFSKVSPHNLGRMLLDRFVSDGSETGVFFTLNQDLYIERHFAGDSNINCPAIWKRHREADFSNSPLKNSHYYTLPSMDSLRDRKNDFHSDAGVLNYIKLHGSLNWIGNNNSERLVIGHNKEDQIGSEPLLSWYFDIFRRALLQADVRLLAIGYSFRDKHINDILKAAIEDYNLRLYVISPQSPESFSRDLNNNEDRPWGKTILRGLHGYFKYSLDDIFPQTLDTFYSGAGTHHAWYVLERSYFQK